MTNNNEILEQFCHLGGEDAYAAWAVGGVLFACVLSLVIGLVFYVFRSIGQYSLSKRRGIKHAWLAWIPVASAWNYGCISDQYQYLVKGKNTHRRTVLLWLNIFQIVLAAAILVFIGTIISAIVHYAMGILSDVAFERTIMEQVFMLSGIYIIEMAIVITYLVFYFIASYDLYTSCTPSYGVLLLVLSILFGFTQPFFIFAFRGKDGGMPPRKNSLDQV